MDKASWTILIHYHTLKSRRESRTFVLVWHVFNLPQLEVEFLAWVKFGKTGCKKIPVFRTQTPPKDSASNWCVQDPLSDQYYKFYQYTLITNDRHVSTNRFCCASQHTDYRTSTGGCHSAKYPVFNFLSCQLKWGILVSTMLWCHWRRCTSKCHIAVSRDPSWWCT